MLLKKGTIGFIRGDTALLKSVIRVDSDLIPKG